MALKGFLLLVLPTPCYELYLPHCLTLRICLRLKAPVNY